MLRSHRLAFLQSLSHRPATQGSSGRISRLSERKSRVKAVSGEAVSLWQELPHQLIRFGSLNLQFIRSLPDQILQVGTVLLQHSQHGVDDVCLLSFVNAPKLQRSTQTRVLSNVSEAAVPARASRGSWALTCLKMSSKPGLLLGSSLQHSFIRLRHSVGASSTETIGLQRGGGFFRRSSISAGQTGGQTGAQRDRCHVDGQPSHHTQACPSWRTAVIG